MILVRLHIFYLVFAIFFGGILFYQVLPMTIPLMYDISQGKLLWIVFTAFAAFWIGTRLAPLRPAGPKDPGKDNTPKPISFNLILVVFILLLIFAATLFYERGIPAFASGEKAFEIKGELTLNTQGRTRVADVFLPYISLYLLGLSRRYSRKCRMIAWATVLCVLGFQILASFKGNIAFYLFGIMYVLSMKDAGTSINLKKVLLTSAVASALMIFVFAITEGGGDSINSAIYVMNRALVYSWEGFNYIVRYDLKPDILQQLQSMSPFVEQLMPPDRQLAAEFFNSGDPKLGIIPTLFGFLYRNGGTATVACGFLCLGTLVKRLEQRIAESRRSMNSMILDFFLYIMLLRIFLVGNIFNELRGYGVTVIVIFMLVRLLETQGSRRGSSQDRGSYAN